MSKKQELVKQETNEVAEVSALDAWGPSQMDKSDLVIPKLLLMQGLSKAVADGVAKMGDFVNSLTNEVLGDANIPVTVVPIYMNKFWTVSQVQGNRFIRTVQYGPENANLSWRGVEKIDGNNVEIKNELTRSFYVLPKKDGHLQPTPMIISFKGMSSKAGQILASQMYSTNQQLKLPPPGFNIDLSATKVSNAKGTFFVLAIKPTDKSTNEEMAEALKWYKVINSTGVNIDPKENDAPNFADAELEF